MLNDKQIASALIGLGPATVLLAAGLMIPAGIMLVFAIIIVALARSTN